MASDDLGLAQPPAQAAEGDVRKALASVQIEDDGKSATIIIPGSLVLCFDPEDGVTYALWNGDGYTGGQYPASERPHDAAAEIATALSADAAGTIAAARKQAAEEMRERAAVPDGWQLVPIEPTEAMWGELARQIVMWSRFTSPTGRALHDHLRHSGYARPDWLLALIPYVDHVPSKGDVAVAIYRAMLAAAPPLPSSSPEDQQKAAATPTIADPDGESGR